MSYTSKLVILLVGITHLLPLSITAQKDMPWFIEPAVGGWLARSFNYNHRPIALIFGGEIGKRVYNDEYFNVDVLGNFNATTHQLRAHLNNARTWVMLYEAGGRVSSGDKLIPKDKGSVFLQWCVGMVDENSSVQELHQGPQWEFSQTWAVGYTFPNRFLGGWLSFRWDAVYSREGNSSRDIQWMSPKASLRFNL